MAYSLTTLNRKTIYFLVSKIPKLIFKHKSNKTFNNTIKRLLQEFSYVEPAHDALVRGWEKLLAWKQKEEESLLLQRRLIPAADEWKIQQQIRFLWNANPRLDLLKKVLKSDDNWLNKVETEFVQRSLQRRRNNRRGLIISVSGVILILSGLTFFSFAKVRELEKASEQFEIDSIKVLGEFPINIALNITDDKDPPIPGDIKALNEPPWTPLLKHNNKVFAMSRKYHKGKVLAIAHDGILTKRDNSGFMFVVLNFLNGINGNKQVLISKSHCEFVTLNEKQSYSLAKNIKKSSYEIEDISAPINSTKLKEANILIIGNAWGNLENDELEAIEQFVSKGGKLLAVGLGWSWKKYSDQPNKAPNGGNCNQKGQDKTKISTYPMNKLLEQFGARFESSWINL